MEKLKRLEAGAIRAYEDDGVKRLEVLAAPFGSPTRKDRLNQYLSSRTDFMIDVGDKRPLLYLHGFSPQGRSMDKPVSIGTAEVSRTDEQGLWMVAEMDDSELANRTWKAALDGKAKASTGSVSYLVRPQPDKEGKLPEGEVKTWPIAELSVFDTGGKRTPVSDDTLVIPLRATYEQLGIELPEGFEAGEDKGAKKVDKSTLDTQGELTMDEKERKEFKDSLKEEVMEEMKNDPKYRATFNVNSIDDTDAKGDAGKEETFAFVRGLLEDGKRVANGGMPVSKRVLEESEALEIGPMVPEDLYNQIHDIRGKYSIIRRAPMKIYSTDKLTFSVPTETTAMTKLADIAEEGAYVANEAAFASKTATMQKVGSKVTVTEEALEDQDLFQQYLVQMAGKALALAENEDLNALLDTISGTDLATGDTITDSEVLQTMYFGLAQEYRNEGVFIMGDGTLGYLNAMTLSNDRAYGNKGFEFNEFGELGERFLGKPVFTNSNWSDLSAGVNEKAIDFVNLNECLYWVERRGLSIFVDPYSTRASAGTINYLPSARYGGVVVNSAALSGLTNIL